MKLISSLALLIVFAFSALAQKPWTPAGMIKYNRLTGAIISPDGKNVAYTISVPQMEGEKSEFLTHIWMAATDGSSNHQFTFGEKSCTNPQFSPDGKWLSFTSARKEDKSQLYIISMTGGEAQQITKMKNDIEGYEWSPDGKQIAFLVKDPLTESEEKDNLEKRDMVVADDYRNVHLYTVAIKNNEEGTHPVKRLTSGNFHVTDLTWSRDSKTIAFTHQINPSLDQWTTSDISSIPADSGIVKSLVAGKGSDANPKYSHDGQWLAYSSDGGEVKWAERNTIYIIPATGGASKKLSATYDQSFQILDWSPDSKSILFSEVYKTNRVIYSLSIDGKPKMITPADGVYGSPSFSKSGDLMAYVYQNASTPPDVMVMNLKDLKSRKLSTVNEAFSKMRHAKTEVVSWKSKDGKYDIEGLITFPTDYQKGKKYPLVLNIHGGPAGVFTQNYTGASSVYPIQAFAQQGYAVLRANPRGSSGYGADFRQANFNDWGFGDYDDIMGGVDKLITDGIAHPDSLCVTGWSYGGYMTSMIITKTNRFKASMVGAGVTNLISFNGTADIPGFLPDYFGGEFWDRTDVYMKHSAMFGVKNVKTPTLIIHGEKDLRVPISQGQELYAALKKLDVKTQMVSYPRTPHGPQEPKFIQDIGERTINWFNEICRKQDEIKPVKLEKK
ncbi:MAG: S9 family peptidase [Bacteroidia bacterium]|nr:S9 family peptidase [Bacteroidia bacterium]